MAPRISGRMSVLLDELGQECHVRRPTLQASRPSQTIAQIGPLSMSAAASQYDVSMQSLGVQHTCDKALKEWLI